MGSSLGWVMFWFLLGLVYFMSVLDMEKIGGGTYGRELIQVRPARRLCQSVLASGSRIRV